MIKLLKVLISGIEPKKNFSYSFWRESEIMKRSASTSLKKKAGQLKKPNLVQNTEKDESTETEKIQNDFVKIFVENRKSTADSIIEFSFNKKRVRILSKATEVPDNAKGILYWMSRDARVQDNWAFLFAQKLALKNELPLHCCFCLVPKFLDATIRHYKFLLKGLEEVAKDCKELNIYFHLLIGPAVTKIPEFLQTYGIGAVVCDLSPLRVPTKWVDDIKGKLPPDIPLCQVDAHNIVPVWFASDKQEYAARTIRNKINSKLDTFLTEFPPLISHKYKGEFEYNDVDWDLAYKSLEVNMIVDEVEWAIPGYIASVEVLQQFCTHGLKKFHDKRNDPVENALSNLSPWFHFGQISVQRCILTVNKYKKKYSESVAAFCEEAIIRRELSDNYCFYNKNYDNLNGISQWALKTLNDHRKDKRSYIYTKDEFEYSKTHDDLWNSAQIQLVKEGKMHGFLRMYWAKKILEWTETPEIGLEVAIYLNDKYSLDGRDPNGYVGCLWSIGGLHDQGWAERPIFGKIRFMNYQGCKRKFNISAFIARYGGKICNKK